MNDNLIFKLRSVTTSDSPLTLVRLLNQSADEIERLHNELADWQRTVRALEDHIQHLRQLGSSLVSAMQSGSDHGWDEAIDDWKASSDE